MREKAFSSQSVNPEIRRWYKNGQQVFKEGFDSLASVASEYKALTYEGATVFAELVRLAGSKQKAMAVINGKMKEVKENMIIEGSATFYGECVYCDEPMRVTCKIGPDGNAVEPTGACSSCGAVGSFNAEHPDDADAIDPLDY